MCHREKPQTHNLLIACTLATATMASEGTVSAQTTSTLEELRNKTTFQRSFNAWRDGTGGPFDRLAENGCCQSRACNPGTFQDAVFCPSVC